MDNAMWFFLDIVRAAWMPMILSTVLILMVWAVCRLGERRLSPAFRCYLRRLMYVKLLAAVVAVFVLNGGWNLKLPPPPQVQIVGYLPAPADVISAQPRGSVPTATTYRVEPHRMTLMEAVSQAINPTVVQVSSNSYSITEGAEFGWLNSLPTDRIATDVYFLGACFLLFRLVRSWRRARWLASHATEVHDAEARATLSDLCRRLGLKRQPRLGEATALRGPMYVSGAILMPTRGVPEGAEPLILAHEAAHARRCDLAWEWVGALTQALFFFHPLVYVMRREERIARESAADALALRLTGVSPADYARMLVTLSLTSDPAPPGAVGAIERGSALRRRLLGLRNAGRCRSAAERTAAGIIAVVLTGAALTPLTVSAENGGSAVRSVNWQPTDDPVPHLPKDPHTVTGDKRVRGILRDSSGKPFRGARVGLYRTFFGDDVPGTVRAAKTDANGRFDFNHLPPGEYTAVVNPIGVPEWIDSEISDNLYGSGQSIYIPKARQAPVETDFTAYRYGTITGRVLDRATGKPLAGIAVGEIDATRHGGSYTQTGHGVTLQCPRGRFGAKIATRESGKHNDVDKTVPPALPTAENTAVRAALTAQSALSIRVQAGTTVGAEPRADRR